MKKRNMYIHKVGSAEFVVAHARWQESRGRRASQHYAGIKDPEKALALAVRNAKAFEEQRETARLLKGPMLQCLARVIGEIEEQLQYWNDKVKAEAGVDLDLEFVSATQVAEDKWVVRVRGNAWNKRREENVFTIVWMGHTCAANFHLLQRGHGAWSGGLKDLYNGVLQTDPRSIAKELAIYTHHQQIPGVLSRL